MQGIGGLGHLGIQYASKLGLKTVAVGRGKDKRPLARQLGAAVYLDAAVVNPAEELQRLGGAGSFWRPRRTAKRSHRWSTDWVRMEPCSSWPRQAEPVMVNAITLIGKRASVQGWPSGTAKDSEDTLRFSAMTGVRPMIERYPLARAPEAYQQMMSGKARFRAV